MKMQVREIPMIAEIAALKENLHQAGLTAPATNLSGV
jgi:hypothetical protein